MSERDIHGDLKKLRVNVNSQTVEMLKNLDALKATLDVVEKDTRLQMSQHWLANVEKSTHAMLFLEPDSEGGEALDSVEQTFVSLLEQGDFDRAVKNR